MDLNNLHKKCHYMKNSATKVTERGDCQKNLNVGTRNLDLLLTRKNVDSVSGKNYTEKKIFGEHCNILNKQPPSVVVGKLDGKKCMKDKSSFADSVKDRSSNAQNGLVNTELKSPNITENKYNKHYKEIHKNADALKFVDKVAINKSRYGDTTTSASLQKQTAMPKNDNATRKIPKVNSIKPIDNGTELKIDLSDPNNTKTAITNENKMKKSNQTAKKATVRTYAAPNDATRIYKSIVFEPVVSKTRVQISMPHHGIKLENCSHPSSSPLLRKKYKPVNPKEKTADSRKKSGKVKKTKGAVSTLGGETFKAESANWEPSSISKHTQPYYEAWVDTTLAATTKVSSKDKDKMIFEKEQIIQDLRRALVNRPQPNYPTEEELRDQRFVGTIKVNR